MKTILKKYFVNVVLIVGCAFLALYFTLKEHIQEVWLMFQNIRIIPLLIVMTIILFCQLIVGWILQQYVKIVKKDYSLKSGFVNALVASFFHGITPGASGGQFAQVFVFYKQGVLLEQSMSVLIIDFIVYQMTMVMISLVLLLWKVSYFMSHSIFLLAMVGFGINASVILILILCTYSSKVYTWIAYVVIDVLARLHIVKDAIVAREKMDSKLKEFASGVMILGSNKRLLVKVVIANIFRLLIYFMVPGFCCWVLGIEISLNQFFMMIAFTSFVMNVNACIPIPGASGGTESVFVLVFSMLLTSVEASSVMVIWRFMTYYVLMIIGAIVFVKVQKEDVV